MKGFLSDLCAALSAEILKTKRTLALRLAFLAPLLVVLLEFLILWRQGAKAGRSGHGIWMSLTQNSLLLWDLLMIPLFVTLETALLAGLEHSSNSWKHLFALPVSRRATYTAKQLLALALIGVSTTVLWAAMIAAGLLLRFLKPGIGFEAAVPVWRILWFTLLSYACSWLIIAIHTWVAMRSPSFVVAMGVGVAATVVAVIVLQSDYNVYYPWTLPAVVTRFAIVEGQLRYLAIGSGLIGGIALAIVALLDFSRRDVM